MSEFEVQCLYHGVTKEKFFNDKEPQEYYKFWVTNANDIPLEYLFSTKKDNFFGIQCHFFILVDVAKRVKVSFAEPSSGVEEKDKYRFVVNLGEKGAANFKTKYKESVSRDWENSMVLKTKDYFEKTVKKIGFWGSEDYFYEKERNNKNNDNSLQDRNKSNLTKIFLFALPIILLTLFFILIIKWVSKRKTIK